MKKLTPLQEFKEWYVSFYNSNTTSVIKPLPSHIMEKVEQLLIAEKQEIIEAYKSGNALTCDCYDAATTEDAIKYITDTYETK